MFEQLMKSARHSAIHLETRDLYLPADPDWNEWKAGGRFDPVERWRPFYDLVQDASGRGVRVRRARVVSEPVSAYVQYEYDLTEVYNIAAGEDVRWLPRGQAADVLVPANDFWVFDNEVVLWNFFDGDSGWVGEGRVDDPDLAKVCVTSFDSVWARAIPHKEYQPA